MNLPLVHDQRCPLCNGPNGCRIADGCLYRDSCWCEEVVVPPDVLRLLAEQHAEPSCLCRRCLAAVAHHAKEQKDATHIVTLARAEITPDLSPADYIIDECGRTVFTAAYHLKRGYCCQNGCRYCPYQPPGNTGERPA